MDDSLTATLSAQLAANLKLIREQRDLTQAKLALLCELPRSTIANIEAGSGNPTLAVLARLGAALRLPLDQLLALPRARCELFKAGSLPVLKRGREESTVIRKLLPHPIPGMEIDRLELSLGAVLTGLPHHPGTHEYTSCEQGRIELRVAGERHELEPGDVVAFAADQRHSYKNTGEGDAVAFSVVTLAPVAT